jgi:hypothetical protein
MKIHWQLTKVHQMLQRTVTQAELQAEKEATAAAPAPVQLQP